MAQRLKVTATQAWTPEFVLCNPCKVERGPRPQTCLLTHIVTPPPPHTGYNTYTKIQILKLHMYIGSTLRKVT